MDLSFRRITGRIDLEFESIENLCKFKLENFKGDKKREFSVHKIMESEIFELFEETSFYTVRIFTLYQNY